MKELEWGATLKGSEAGKPKEVGFDISLLTEEYGEESDDDTDSSDSEDSQTNEGDDSSAWKSEAMWCFRFVYRLSLFLSWLLSWSTRKGPASVYWYQAGWSAFVGVCLQFDGRLVLAAEDVSCFFERRLYVLSFENRRLLCAWHEDTAL